jgi:hypothetical protein
VCKHAAIDPVQDPAITVALHIVLCVVCRPQWAIYTAVYLCHQYFAKRSFQRNDKYVSIRLCLLDPSCREQALAIPAAGIHTFVQEHDAADAFNALVAAGQLVCN